jgi:hypothetical protein
MVATQRAVRLTRLSVACATAIPALSGRRKYGSACGDDISL